MKLAPLTSPLAARVAVPGSKSHTNRALLVAALAEGITTLENALYSDDSLYFARALETLGFNLALDQEGDRMTITGLGGRIPAVQADLFIGNAGTAARFLTALLALGHGEYALDGVGRMRQRPIGDLVNALGGLGAEIRPGGKALADPAAPICPPLAVDGRGLAGGRTAIRGDTSSQFLSGLLMVAPYARGTVEIFVEGPLHSKPYIELTLGVMADFGVEVRRDGYTRFQISPQVYETPGVYPVESDASAASYFFAAPAVCGGWVEVRGLTRAARQGDICFLEVLEKMGCTVSEVPGAVRVHGPERFVGVDVDMSDISDTSMTLAAVAPFAESPTTIRGIASSRVKETDRVTATVAELRRLSVQVDEHHDGMTIYPCADITPARIRTYDDHRMAMAFSLVGLKVPGIEIEDPDCVSKTFPDYFQVLAQLGRGGLFDRAEI